MPTDEAYANAARDLVDRMSSRSLGANEPQERWLEGLEIMREQIDDSITAVKEELENE
jgi:hypothetical protein